MLVDSQMPKSSLASKNQNSQQIRHDLSLLGLKWQSFDRGSDDLTPKKFSTACARGREISRSGVLAARTLLWSSSCIRTSLDLFSWSHSPLLHFGHMLDGDPRVISRIKSSTHAAYLDHTDWLRVDMRGFKYFSNQIRDMRKILLPIICSYLYLTHVRSKVIIVLRFKCRWRALQSLVLYCCDGVEMTGAQNCDSSRFYLSVSPVC